MKTNYREVPCCCSCKFSVYSGHNLFCNSDDSYEKLGVNNKARSTAETAEVFHRDMGELLDWEMVHRVYENDLCDEYEHFGNRKI